MRVLPLSERPDDLYVLKSDAVRKGVVLSDHALPKWPNVDHQFSSVPIRERPRRLSDFDLFPRRQQPLESTGESVPGEQFLGRGGHQTTLDEFGHGVTNRKIGEGFTASSGSYRQFGETRPAQPVLPAGLGLLVPISTDSIDAP